MAATDTRIATPKVKAMMRFMNVCLKPGERPGERDAAS
jgi:hypothetical protein